jgi:ABC-2 type transport system ATP-binding protein
MSEITLKLNSIETLLNSDVALLEIALKESLDFVEEYGKDASAKVQIVEASLKLRQLKKQKRTEEAVFFEQKQVILNTLQLVFNDPLPERIGISSLNSISPLSESTPIIRLNNIEKSYQSHNFTLKDINLDFHLGKIVGIVGANANGKSTLIKIMVGELLPNSGVITFPFFQPNQKKLNWLELKNKIAYVPQELSEWHGSLRDNLCVEATLHGITGDENILRVDFILERLGLTEFTNRKWHELSGGYKLRFALAKALVWKPNFLVLDEPLANLDMASQMIVLQDLKELVKSLRFPLGIVITSQHIHEIEQIADQLVVLEQGQIVYEGHPIAFKADGENLIFEFACTHEWSEMTEILRGCPVLSVQRQGKYFIVQFDKQTYSIAQFLSFLMQNNIQLSYFRDITHSVKQLFLST